MDGPEDGRDIRWNEGGGNVEVGRLRIKWDTGVWLKRSMLREILNPKGIMRNFNGIS